ncbi:MAG TPA: metalloregulator ArsR/SmtB family transcription factor [Steroidobacteraceae bacterium]|nr:metalloregulator ArsR/SmtB family transcription factor [Steroidobacteraceae bacterium]
MATAGGSGRRRRSPPLAEVTAHAPEAAALLKALASEPRLLVLCSLLGGPLSVGEINGRVPLSQSALSQHLAVLRAAGIVATRRKSQAIYYSLVPGPAEEIMAALYAAYCAAPRRGRGGRRR